MGRKNRSEVFVPTEVAIVHTICKVIRRCMLLGIDPATQKNCDHRKIWIENELQRLAQFFGIDLLAFSILSTHVHQVLRSRPDIVATWTDRDVAIKWLQLCPTLQQINKDKRKQLAQAAKMIADVENAPKPDSQAANASGENPQNAAELPATPTSSTLSTSSTSPDAAGESISSAPDAAGESASAAASVPFFVIKPTEAAINKLANNAKELAALRLRLSDISWWMRLMCQRVAQWANIEEGEDGRFWRGRFRSIRLMDETAILACTAYVDLNVLRAALEDTLEKCKHTSMKLRIEELQAQAAALDPLSANANAAGGRGGGGADGEWEESAIDSARMQLVENTPSDPALRIEKALRLPIHLWLAPVEIREKDCSTTDPRRKGFLSMTLAEYILLLEWTARQLAPGKSGVTPEETPSILERLKISREIWLELMTDFDKIFSHAAGRPETLDSSATPSNGRYYMSCSARELLTEAPALA